MVENYKYSRVLRKLSGEALQGQDEFGINPEVLNSLAEQLADVINSQSSLKLSLVTGGGNIFRGERLMETGLKRTTGDYMGMLGTLINALAIQEALEARGLATRVLSALEVKGVAENYIRRRAIRHLEKGRVVIFAAGTGNPYFTTDTAAVLRANEIEAEILLKATKVDGVYDSDPESNPEARFLSELTHMEAIKQRLGIMDTTAMSLALENNLPIIVFNLTVPGNIKRVLYGEKVGTIIS
ncbi:MAG: UMP kinase [Candidatus Adiutricales bacterium]